MSELVIKVLNLNKCLKKFGDLRDIDFYPVIRESARRVQGDAKLLAPVNTRVAPTEPIYYLGNPVIDVTGKIKQDIFPTEQTDTT